MRNRRTVTRAVLAGALTIGGAVVAADTATAQDAPGNSGCAGRGLPASKIGVQQFTYLPELFGGGAGVEAVTEHMASLGMRNIERFGGTFGLTLEEYNQMYDDNHVRPVAGHGSLDLDTWDDTLADAKLLGQKYVGSGGFGSPGISTLDDTLQTAANLNELGRRAHQQGMRVYGHNHDGEFTTMHDYDIDGDGDTEPTSALEILIAETDPRWVTFELDVHWARLGLAGGRGNPDLAANLADPANEEALIDFIEAHADRISLMHVKDTAPDGSFADVGAGTTDWGDVFRAATSVKHYFIEYDFPPDAFASVENSYAYLDCLTF